MANTEQGNNVLRSSDDPTDQDVLDLKHVNTSISELLKDEKKLTVQDCKAYLRKHGLRLAGTKQVLIERIREHLQIQDDNGMTKYPEDTFNIDCQGDACIGDVVLFKQSVYEFFKGPPVGVRTIAGRIIKESYGSSKQQHTFTVEVLWSTGARALPPLHPLIIKGRNLYRVKTLRQAWAEEEARKKRLQEKHARGAAARMERKVRIEGRNANMHFRKHAKAFDTVCAFEVKFDSSLAGLIIGKDGAYRKEIQRISGSELYIDRDPVNPTLCIVTIRGTVQQKDAALKMVYQKVCCRFFAMNGECRYGEACKFLHALEE